MAQENLTLRHGEPHHLVEDTAPLTAQEGGFFGACTDKLQVAQPTQPHLGHYRMQRVFPLQT
ncbi:hypothetical protein DPMN_190915 [Dreissena polymorpha]|uniref:Uncharacterized protein n=1 Tax=Dreissena polymorpha TaxID=45954 RepID=A0A9D3XZS7_DREPO|nr:hypothetical protein DPMN_190915 [Dreissena polymorpha]